MLYKFKSAEASDVLMLEPHGRRLVEIIGKTPGPTGIILPEQMPAALAALRAAIDFEVQQTKKAASAAADPANDQNPAQEEDENDNAGKGVNQPGLRQRAAPLITMLERSHKAGVQVVWGV